MKIATYCICCCSKKLLSTPAILMPFIAARVFGWRPLHITSVMGLRTLQNGTSYAACNSLRCVDCGCIFLDMRFDQEEMERLYKNYRGKEYVALRAKYEPDYPARNERLKGGIDYMQYVESFLIPHLSFPLRILDWGGDTGKNTPFADGRSVIRHIYDINCAEPVVGCQSVDNPHPDAYDLVVCSNVLEHVSWPHLVLGEILHRAMKKETILYIEIPEERAISHREPKHHWHEHVNFFTETGLRELLERLSLELIDFHRFRGPGLMQFAVKRKQ